MIRRLRMSFAFLVTASLVASSTYAAPPLGHLKQNDWFADRGLDDPGVAGETAVYLQVDSNTNANKFYGQLTVYQEQDGMHERAQVYNVSGDWTARKDKRRSALLYEYDETTGVEGALVAGMTYWYDRHEEGGNQLRVAIRLMQQLETRTKDDDPCDQPPDDDILEEEEEIPNESTPPDETFDEYGDPYVPGP